MSARRHSGLPVPPPGEYARGARRSCPARFSLRPVTVTPATAPVAADPPVAVLVLSHGNLARELLESARTIAGELEWFEALSLDWRTPVDIAERSVGEAVERLDRGSGVLVLADIFGGTPSNLARRLEAGGRVRVVSGVNLPMVVRLGCQRLRGMTLDQLACWIRTKGRASICGVDGLDEQGREAR